MRIFQTGATRDTDSGKPDYDGFLSPLVIERFGRYMHKHRRQADGSMRDSDNWQRGIPLDAYRKSAFRHFIEFWTLARAEGVGDAVEEALCALLFNVQGYLHEAIKARNPVAPARHCEPVFRRACRAKRRRRNCLRPRSSTGLPSRNQKRTND